MHGVRAAANRRALSVKRAPPLRPVPPKLARGRNEALELRRPSVPQPSQVMFSERDRQKCLDLYTRYYAGGSFTTRCTRTSFVAICGRGRGCWMPGAVGTCASVMNSPVRRCRRRGPGGIVRDAQPNSVHSPVRGDIGALPFPSDSFDMVISRSVVEHLDDPPQAFREFFRVLRPGGKVDHHHSQQVRLCVDHRGDHAVSMASLIGQPHLPDSRR